MNFIYHGVPEPMAGNQLIPLNQIRSILPNVLEKNLEKYKGREEILERKIPLLECLWNDVVQFLPLHPHKVFEAQKELRLISSLPPYKFYEIDLSNLDPTKTVVFFKTAPGEENVKVKWLSEVNLKSLQEIPKATRRYYESLIGTGELPFNYQFIPHLLYRGMVDISDANIFTLGSKK
jgi:hypothetical protein